MTLSAGILDDAQTYIGVLATFLVLCIFAHRDKSENADGNNFIFNTLLKLNEELKEFLRNKVLELKKDIRSVYEQSESNKTSDLINELKQKYNETYKDNEKQRDEKEAVIFKNRLKASLLPFKFADEAETKIKLIDALSIKEREELALIALFTLFCIMTTMCLDCLTFIPINYRCILTNIILLISLEFLLILYHKYCHTRTKVPNHSEQCLQHPRLCTMWLGMLFLFIIWLVLVVPNCLSGWLAIIAFIAFLTIGLCLMKRRWIILNHRFNRYNRTFVIHHYTYIIIIAIIISITLYNGDTLITLIDSNNQRLTFWNNVVAILSNKEYTRIFAIIFFTLNGFALPFIVGWLPMILEKRHNERYLRHLQKEYKREIMKCDEEIRRIQRGLGSTHE